MERLNRKLFLGMCEKQEVINTITNGEDWKNGFTKEGRKIDFKMCINDEGMELLNCYPWEHWRNINKEVYHDNVIVEMADIWFFAISILIKEYQTPEEIESFLNDLPHQIKDNYDTPTHSVSEDVEHIKEFITYNLSYERVRTLFVALFKLCGRLGIGLVDIHKQYMGKYFLNVLRQEQGYKDGYYIKQWDDGEDNVFLHNLLHNEKVELDTIEERLNFKYRDVRRSNPLKSLETMVSKLKSGTTIPMDEYISDFSVPDGLRELITKPFNNEIKDLESLYLLLIWTRGGMDNYATVWFDDVCNRIEGDLDKVKLDKYRNPSIKLLSVTKAKVTLVTGNTVELTQLTHLAPIEVLMEIKAKVTTDEGTTIKDLETLFMIVVTACAGTTINSEDREDLMSETKLISPVLNMKKLVHLILHKTSL